MARVGFEWEDVSGVLDKIVEEVEEFRRAATPAEQVHELGDLFLVMVNLCRWLDIQAEDALRQANGPVPPALLADGRTGPTARSGLCPTALEDKESLWQESKKLTG